MATPIGIGIDIAKDTLDVASSDGRWHQTFPMTPQGLQALADQALRLAPHRVVLEASGGYERPALVALHAAGLPVVLVQPGRARSFARAIGQLAKTDAIDARVLARMALVAVEDTPLWQPLDPGLDQLRALVLRRQQLVVQVDAEKKRLRAAEGLARQSVERSLRFLKEELAVLDKQVQELLRQTAPLQQATQTLEEVDGVGRITAVTLLISLPELGQLNRKQIAALAGLAPINRDSGQSSGQRSIRGGRARARKALYMAALAATRFNAHIREVYARLRAKGKPAKVALVACMRKLLTHLNARMRQVLEGQQGESLAAR